MSIISTLNTRPYQTGGSPTTTQKADRSALLPGTSFVAGKGGDAVQQARDGMSVENRLASLGKNTMDLADNLINSFTKALFGDAAKGATISFDSASLEAQASTTSGSQQTSGPNGVRSSSFSLNESAQFTGKGTITTADGRKFDFEMEIKYEFDFTTTVSGPAASWSDGRPPRSEADPLPPVEFPDINFPGSLADLFKLFEKPLKTDIRGEGKDEKIGTLSLRLLNLVNSSKLLDTYALPGAKGNAAKDGAPTPATPVQIAAPSATAASRAAAYAPQAETVVATPVVPASIETRAAS